MSQHDCTATTARVLARRLDAALDGCLGALGTDRFHQHLADYNRVLAELRRLVENDPRTAERQAAALQLRARAAH